ncbi:MAG: MBL fold metallo-hydrolase [Chitinophagaceae bacterium]|jgi:glyoxylase-like metal-dependent hydrolase (beta-lactamase superfamily II)|nr:MBL fold metallo-hydrolase [Chitinophagaceae bacterium]
MLQIKQFTFSPMAENTYVVYNENKEACIIDPGCFSSAEKQDLDGFLQRNGLSVKYLLLTHAHLDHVFGLKWAVEKYGLIPYMHPSELPVLQRGAQMGLMYGLPFDAYNGPTADIADGDLIQLGNDQLEVIFAPGHSPGHVCFYCKAEKAVLGGDVLFNGSIGRTDLPGGDFNRLIQSIRSKLFVLPDEITVYSGHGPETTIGSEKKFNPFLT